nr:hypothetical protein [uncultured Sediminibacterium sp.]
MKIAGLFLNYSILFALTILSLFNSCDAKPKNSENIIHLVGCTPADDEIKQQLSIPLNTKADFIRWNLTLSEPNTGDQVFTLSIVYGESKPNTLGFIGGGLQKKFEGRYTVSENNERPTSRVYHLKSNKKDAAILLEKLSDNIFHLLTIQHKLMIGNGGWSYTLNRKKPLLSENSTLPAFAKQSAISEDTATQIIFEGRTPCLEFAAEHNLTVQPDCFKLKWKLTLSKDPVTLKPSSYALMRTNSRETAITGTWTILKGLPGNPNTVIYKLDPDQPTKSISLLLGDENIAFFLHKNNHFFIGNEDFSFTLNKRQNN